MSGENEFVYDTWLRERRLGADFHRWLATVLRNDFQRNPKEELDDGDENDPFRDENDENNLEYTTAENASDIEADLIIEPN